MAGAKEAPDGPVRRPRGRPRGAGGGGGSGTVRSLDRALVVLGALSRRDGATLTEIARATEQSPATVHRILATLAAHGMVEAEAAGQTWHVGHGAFLIGSVFLRRTSLVERALPVLRGLMEETGETANLGVLSGRAVLFVSGVEAQAPIRAFFPPGTRSPLHASGVGKVLLASMGGERRRALLGERLARFTARTVTDRAALEREIAEVARRGHALDDEERNEGMRCIAAPVRDLHGETVAGLSVSGPVSRVRPERIEALATTVTAAAARLSAALGAR